MNFIHEPTLSCGNHNIGCPLSTIVWQNCNFKSILDKNFHDLNFNDWSKSCSNKCSSKNWRFTRENVFSLHNGMICPKPSSSSNLVSLLIPSDTLCPNDASSQTLVNRIVSDSDSKSSMFSRKQFPDTNLGEDTKSFTSCDFTLVNTLTVTDSFCFSCLFSLSSRIVHTNSKLLRKYWADLQNEWSVTRARCLKHPHWSVWCLCYFSFIKIPRLKALILLKTGWPVSFNLSTIWAVLESHFPSGV